MKSLKNHVILYDDDCPMCALYTKAFVDTGMLDSEGRQPYSNMHCELKEKINTARACDEIALVDTRSGEVTYGVESLFRILENNAPFAKSLFRLTAFRWIMKKVYSFISFNRKVIVPPKEFERDGSCTPAYNLTYRWAYLIFTWIISSLILNEYSRHLYPFIPESNLWREFAICGGQLVFQSVTISLLRRERLMHYLGNMMTISFAGSLLLVPALVVAKLGIEVSAFFYLGWFAVVVTLMFLEHIRRVGILGIHWSASLSWVVYRLIVLLIIL
jgi:predicted DCC family thiol-disulfide oxidoreductase YuxK